MDSRIRDILDDAARSVDRAARQSRQEIADEWLDAQEAVRSLFPIASFQQFIRVTPLALTPPGREVEGAITSLFDSRVRLLVKASAAPSMEGGQVTGTTWILAGNPYIVFRSQPAEMYTTDDPVKALGMAWKWTQELKGVPGAEA